MSKFRYAIIGKGNWGQTVYKMLSDRNSSAYFVDHIHRRALDCSPTAYETQISETIPKETASADIVWLAVPPGDQFPLLKVLTTASKHTIVEKPLLLSRRESTQIQELASKERIQIGVDFQYCHHPDFVKIRTELGNRASNYTFGGFFHTSKKNRLRLPAHLNLGIHFCAVKEHHFPSTVPSKIDSAYERPERREIWITGKSRHYKVDFLHAKAPMLQNLVENFERCAVSTEKFPFDLEFNQIVMAAAHAQC